MKKLTLLSLTLLVLLTGCTKTGTAYSTSYELQDYENEIHIATLYTDKEMFDYDYNTKEKTNERICSDNQEVALSLLDAKGDDFNFESLGANTYKATLEDASKYINKLTADGYACTSIERTPADIDAKYTNNANNIRIIISCNGVVRIFCISSENLPFDPPYICE